jgi:hypothetical protein
MGDEILNKYAKRVGYSGSEIKLFMDKGHRIRQMKLPAASGWGTIASFFATVMQNDFDALKTGHRSLKSYYEALAS